jgi:hypothetical protein
MESKRDLYASQHQRETPRDSQQNIGLKDYLGCIFILTGALIAFWVFLNVYKIFTNPQEMVRFQQLVSSQLETLVSSEKGEVKVVIPREVLAYIVPLFLLMIGVGVAGVFIKGGVSLLYGSFQRFLMRIARLEQKIEKEFQSIKDSFKKESK